MLKRFLFSGATLLALASCAQFDAEGSYLGLTLLGGENAATGSESTDSTAGGTTTTTAAEINAQQAGTDLLSGTGSYDFGSITNDGNNGTTSAVTTFTIQNTGTADLNITSVTISAGDTTEFDIDTSGVSSPVSGGSTTTFTLTFDPTATAAASATVTIANDDADESTYTFTITGTGTAAEINTQQAGTDLLSGTGSYDFGSITNDGNNGTTSAVTTFTIQNTGTADLSITSVTISAGDTTEFDIDTSGVSSPVSGGSTTTFTLTFDPTATAAASATVTIANDDADESTYTFTITGTGTAATSKRVFVTNGTSNGAIGALAVADAFCVADASNPAGAGTGTWKALLVYGDGTRTACTTANCGTGGAGENTDWPFAALTSYTRSDGTTAVFTTDASGIFTYGTLTNAFAGAGDRYWTGLNADWTTNTIHCTNWTVGTGGGNQGAKGIDNATDSTSISGAGGSPQCNQTYKLLCVEQ